MSVSLNGVSSSDIAYARAASEAERSSSPSGPLASKAKAMTGITPSITLSEDLNCTGSESSPHSSTDAAKPDPASAQAASQGATGQAATSGRLAGAVSPARGTAVASTMSNSSTEGANASESVVSDQHFEVRFCMRLLAFLQC